MRVEIRSKGIELTAGLREFVERRARFSLGRQSDQVARVQVWLEDVNGPKGGDDKRCRVKLSGPGLSGRLIESSSSDLGAAVFDALERASRVADRAHDRGSRPFWGVSRPWATAS
ncbi:MAG TPA: HPF/RaiA family ribosome-associated protein [Myxococcales bacterium]|jgi:ribosome-associated translation inhibitor RaiA